MAQQLINVGAAPNDGTGDPIRTAYIKCNDNFTELYGRSAVTTANDGVFNLSLSNNFSCTPLNNITLTWNNLVAGQGGYIVFINTTSYSINKDPNTLCDTNLLSTISTSGVYLMNYFCDGIRIYLTSSGELD